MPLGAKPYFANLHGLVNATGGKIVRVEPKDKPEDTIGRFVTAVAAPILYPHTFQLSAEATDVYPTKLPPLRGDAPTLVVGKLSKPTTKLEYTITGTLAGKEIRVPMSLPMPAADVENFFLANVMSQWRDHKDRPALLQADRTLCFAYDQNQMARAKLVADADWALENDKYDHAYRLYQQRLKIDPNNGEAKAGMDIVEELRDAARSRANSCASASSSRRRKADAYSRTWVKRKMWQRQEWPSAGQRRATARTRSPARPAGQPAMKPPEFNPPPVAPDIPQGTPGRAGRRRSASRRGRPRRVRRANRFVLTASRMPLMICSSARSTACSPIRTSAPRRRSILAEQLRSHALQNDRSHRRPRQARNRPTARALAALADARHWPQPEARQGRPKSVPRTAARRSTS